MKALKKLLISLSLVLIAFTNVQSQEFEMPDIERFSVKNSGSIVNERIVKGYYFFYQSPGKGKGTRNYTIVILDENLKEVVSKKMVEGSKVYLLEASYNGTAILLKFYDMATKKVMYRSISNEGEMSEKTSRIANKYEISVFQQSIQKDINNLTLNPFGTQMFIDFYTFKADKGYTFKIDGVDASGKKVWTYAPKHTKGIDAVSYLASDDSQAIMLVYKTTSVLSRDYKFSVLSIDNEGQKRFQIKLENEKYNMMPHHAYIDAAEQKILVIGEYYSAEDKSFKAASKGIFIKTLSLDGEELSQKFISWKKKIYAKLSEEDRDDASSYYLCFHQIVKTANGKIVAVAEQYKKQVSARGVATKVAVAALGGSTNTSSLEIKIANMVVIVIDSSLAVEDVHIVKKNANHIVLAQEYSYTSQHLLARILKSEGNFDYFFTQNDSNNANLTFGYIDREKTEGKKGKSDVFNAINYASAGEGTFSSDKLTLQTKAYDLNVFPAKPGNILIYEYFRKEKRISVRLEPINF